MKKIVLVLTVMVVMMLMSSVVFAAETTAETKKVSIPENLLTEDQKKVIEKADLQEKVTQYGEWVGLGKEIGTAVDSSLGALTNRAEEFANTDVGKFTLFIVAWKVLGNDFLGVIIGILFLAVTLPTWFFVFYRNCIIRKVCIGKEGSFWRGTLKKEYKVVNEVIVLDIERDSYWGNFFYKLCYVGVLFLFIWIGLWMIL